MQIKILWHTLGAYSEFLYQQIAVAAIEVSYKKVVLKTSAKFTEKHMLQSLFFDKVVGPQPGAVILLSLIQMLSKKFLLTIHFFVQKTFLSTVIVKKYHKLFQVKIYTK